jgi:hypothetical protein
MCKPFTAEAHLYLFRKRLLMNLDPREFERVVMSDVDLITHAYDLANRCQTDEVTDELCGTLCEIFERFAPYAAWEDYARSIELAFGDDSHAVLYELAKAREAIRQRRAARLATQARSPV